MLAVAILAAGKGTRMVSSLPKVLHKLSGKTLLNRIINTSIQLCPDKLFVICGHKSNLIEESLSNHKNIKNINFIRQVPQLGTGHAIQVLSKELKTYRGNLLILNGDVPLIQPESLKSLIQLHESENADASIITAKKENPYGYGRVFMKGNEIDKIVEEKDCSSVERANNCINAGIYCFKWESLFEILNNLKSNNNQKEIYLTDAISLLRKSVSFTVNNEDEIQGINNRIHLANCEKVIQKNIINKHMLNGVTFINPESSSVSEDTEIGIDVIIEANTHIKGTSRIGDNCVIGPNSIIENGYIKNNSKVLNSSIFESEVMDNVFIGPYCHIRPGCSISSNSKIGNFVEIKNSSIEKSVKINHLSYIGDSFIGKFTNIGAGTITANYDGIRKNKTLIGEKCNIGSNSVLIAPVNLGNSVTTGAGSVINKNVDDNSLAISRTKQKNIKDWKK